MSDDASVPSSASAPAQVPAPAPTPAPVPAPVSVQDIAFQDDDLVYVDPDTNSVIGRVEWSRNGNPKSMPVNRQLSEADQVKEVSKRGRYRKVYPWGTYRSMKNVFKVAGKQKRKDPNHTLEEVLPKALAEAFWNDAEIAGATKVEQQ